LVLIITIVGKPGDHGKIISLTIDPNPIEMGPEIVKLNATLGRDSTLLIKYVRH